MNTDLTTEVLTEFEMDKNPEGNQIEEKVSVIITAYNSREFLKDAIESVVRQNYSNVEIILVDDGSTPERSAFISSITRSFRDIEIIKQENQGLSAARNTGVRYSTGIYLTFLDHDDIWKPDFLTTLIGEFQNKGYLGAIFSRVEHMTANGILTGRVTKPKLDGLTVKDFLISDPICCGSSFVITRAAFESIGGFDPTFIRAEIPELATRLLFNGWRIKGVDQVLVNYRNTPEGLTSGNLLRKYRLEVLKKVLSASPELGPAWKYRLLLRLNQLRIKLRRRLIALRFFRTNRRDRF